jgi:hypothetical protein
MNEEDYVIVWEAPKLEAPEFRLYYDANGAVICYTGDKSITGNYVVIDAQTFAEGRPDVRVIDGKISRAQPNAVVYKLMPSDADDAIVCAMDDVSIIANNSTGPLTKWKLNIYELQ